MKSSLYRTEIPDRESVYPQPGDMELPVLGPQEMIRQLEGLPDSPEQFLKIYLSLQYWKDQPQETWAKSEYPEGWPALRLQIQPRRLASQMARLKGSVDIWIEFLFLIYLDRHADRDALEFYRSGIDAGYLNYRDLHQLLEGASTTGGASFPSPGRIWSRLKSALWNRIRSRSRAASGPGATARCSHPQSITTPKWLETSPDRIKGKTGVLPDEKSQARERQESATGQLEAASENLSKPGLAFVVPRFGKGFSGGIERLCLEAARILGRRYRLQIYTTCATDYLTWVNALPSGEQRLLDPPATVKRFETRSRDLNRFVLAEGRLKAALRAGKDHGRDEKHPPGRLSAPERGNSEKAREMAHLTQDWLLAQGPISESLEEAISKDARSGKFEAVVFFAFQYSLAPRLIPSLRSQGIPVALVPAAHPDWTLEIPELKRVLSSVDLWITSTPEEQTLLTDTLNRAAMDAPECMPGGLPVASSEKAGSNADPARSQQRGRGVLGQGNQFALFVGRLDPSKGVDQLLQYFLFYAMTVAQPMELVLVGNPAMAIPDHPSIHLAGFVSDATLDELYKRATVLINPSPYESLSIVLLEAWARGLPTLSNGKSAVLEAQTARSGCGLCYRDLKQFILALQEIRSSPDMASKGPDFVRENYNKDSISENYLKAMEYLFTSRDDR